ncbi:MAG: fibronectin type III domain-containing protein [Eubacteriales bacterium]|nr:fibronectin type III domain-containing protein [Eubacteriales bacterium]
MKKILSVLLSVLMVATMLPMQVFAADECDHMITADIWASLPASVKANNPDKEPNANGNGDEVPAFVNAKLPASCTKDGWELHAGDDHGFCILCGAIIPSDPSDAMYTKIPATGHHYETTTEPTCTSEGVMTCSNFSYEYAPTGSAGNFSPTYTTTACTATQPIEKLDHTWGDWTVVVEPTCTMPGYKVRYCTTEGSSSTPTEDREDLPATGHTWDEGKVTAPTCTDEGYTTYTCKVCGATKVEDKVPATGHDWSEWTVTKTATCAEAGVETRVCANDKTHVETRAIEKLAHTYGDVSHVDATCTADGYDVEICSACGSEHRFNQDEYPALGHDLGADQVVEEAPTCTKEGIAVGTCQRCGERQVRVTLDVLGHDYKEEVLSVATCDEEGVVRYTCQRCGDTYDDVTPALGHDWDADWTVVTPATCTEEGVEKKFCSRCDAEQSQTIRPLGHSWDNGVVTDPTCTKGGYTTFTCDRCGVVMIGNETSKLGHDIDEQNRVTVKEPTCEADGYDEAPCLRCGATVRIITPAIGHDYKATVVAPTCEAQGYTLWVCQNDNSHTYKTDFVDALGHDWDQGVVTEAATCEEVGSKLYTCQRCGETYEEVLPALGHDWDNGVVTDPTCTAEGYTTYTCQNDASHTRTDNIVPALGHNYDVDGDGEDDYVVTTPATCTAKGVETATCTRCGNEITRPIPEIPHTFSAERISWPTCTEQGEIIYTCVECGYIVESFEDATGHNFDDESQYNCLHGKNCSNVDKNTGLVCGAEDDSRDYTVTFTENVNAPDDKVPSYYVDGYDFDPETDVVSSGHDYDWVFTEATCEQDAYWIGTCVRERTLADGTVVTCPEDAENHEIRVNCMNTAFGHSWSLLDDGSCVEPTCTTDGVRKYICLNDHSHTYTETIPATGHQFVLDSEHSKAPTCCEDGYNAYVCANTDHNGNKCDASYHEVVPATGNHNYKAVSTTAATCTEEGTVTYACQNEGCTSEYSVVTTPAKGHQYVEDQAQYVEATCYEPGERVFVCKSCGDSYAVTIPATGTHNYEMVSSSAATCTKEGTATYACKDKGCTAQYTVVTTPAKGHQFIVTSKTAATCTTQGYDTYKCANCDVTYTVTTTPATGHQFIVTSRTPATCTTPGYDTYKCVGCDMSYTMTTTPAKGHTAVSANNGFAPTCAKDGKVSDIVCADCGTVLQTGAVIPATGDHKYTEAVQTPATCTKDGVMLHECEECGAQYTTVIPAKGHTAVSADNGVAPTCAEDGKESDVICSVCKATLETGAVIPATGDHKYTEAVETAATCTTDGVMLHECEVCGAQYTTVIPATAHDYKYVETPATCTANGKMVATCKNCGDVQTYVIPATGHIYDSQGVYTAPTCVEDGYTTYTCTVCQKASVTKTEGKAAGHVYKASVTNPAAVNADGTITTACIHCGKSSVETIPAIKNVVLSETIYQYNGKACRPSVSVYDTKGNKIASSNYTVAYTDNKNIGKAKVTITFKGGKYTGKIVKGFKIIPKNVGISDVTTKANTIRFTWGKVSKCDGYQIQYSTSKSFKSKKTVTIKSRKTCTATLKGLKSGKKYYIRVRAYKVVNGQKIYGNWSTTSKKCK